MRVIRHSNGSTIRADAATSTDAATRAVFVKEARRVFAIGEALEAAEAKGDTARVEQLVRESRADHGGRRFDVGAARARYLKACEDRWKAPPSIGATREPSTP